MLNETGLTSPFSSKMMFKRFMETFLDVKNFEGCVSIKLEKDQYKIPDLNTFASFKSVFEEAFLTLPRIDHPMLLGLHSNQEMLSNHSQSKEMFKVLTNFFGDSKIEELEEKILSKQTIKELVEPIKTNKEEDLAMKSSRKSLEYSLALSSASEQRAKLTRERISIIEAAIDAFAASSFDEMFAELHRFQENNARMSEAAVSASNPKANPYSAYKSQEMDSMKSGGFSPDRRDESASMNSDATVNATQVTFLRNKFKKTFLSHELRTLKHIAGWLHHDLQVMRATLRGQTISEVDGPTTKQLSDFFSNQIPEIWKQRVANLNVDLETFSAFVKSLLLKTDQIYNLTVMLKCDLPPVLPINRLLDAQSLFVSFMNASASVKGLNLHQCVFLLSRPKQTLKATQNNTTALSAQTFKFNGLRIRGGTIDHATGLLVEEHSREFESLLGILAVEVVQAPAIPARFVSQYEDEVSHLPFFLHHEDHLNTMNLRNEFYTDRWAEQFRRTDTLQLKNTTQAGPEQSIKARLQRQLTSGPELETDELHAVRIPVYFSTQADGCPLHALPCYLYAYSKLPQPDWTNKCTFACLENL